MATGRLRRSAGAVYNHVVDIPADWVHATAVVDRIIAEAQDGFVGAVLGSYAVGVGLPGLQQVPNLAG